MSLRLDTFTVSQPGIEPVTSDELTKLGIKGRVTHGGVITSMTWSQLALAHLHLRTATRILVRVGRFDAPSWAALASGLRRVAWEEWLPAGASLDVRVATSASKLYHTGGIEERVREAVPGGHVLREAPATRHTRREEEAERTTSPPSVRDAPATRHTRREEEAERTTSPPRLSVRIDKDLVTLSLDASGDALYMRGYREETVSAPIRETLAAALVLWSGWDGKVPLVDPCCGSGTVAIEAAMLARRLPPGRHRSFAWQEWPGAATVDWDKLVAAADADVRASGPVVMASDMDPLAVAVAERNAQRAGVTVATTAVTANDVVLPSRPGWVITNPPYGERMAAELRTVYESVGRLAMSPWHLAVVAAVGTPTSAFGREWSASLPTRNGGLPVRFLRSSGEPSGAAR